MVTHPWVQIPPPPPVYPICYVHVCADIGHALSAISVKNKQAADCVLRTLGFYLEQYPSGLRGSPAKGVGREIGARVRISPAPPILLGMNDGGEINLMQHYLLQ